MRHALYARWHFTFNQKTLKTFKNIRRPTDIPDEGPLCDLLWSDPDTEENRPGWNENDRGVSYVFGKDVLEKVYG